MTDYLNRVRQVVTTTGTGSLIVLDTTSDGDSFFTMAEAGATNGLLYDYILTDGNDVEVQVGQTWTSSTRTFTRSTPSESKVGGTAGTSKIDLSGTARLRIFESAESINKTVRTDLNLSDLDDALAARTNLGGTTVGKALFTAADAAAARTAIVLDIARGVSGLTGQRNASTATRLDLSADRVVFKASSGDVAVASPVSSQAIDIAAAGPAPGGRDQASAFSSGAINFFFIQKDDGTIGGIASQESATTGPTLPSGYTRWAYATTVMAAGGNLQNVWVRGASVFYKSAVIMITHSTTLPTSSTNVVLSTYVPSNALTVKMQCQMDNNSANTGQYTMAIGTDGASPATFYLGVPSNGATAATGGPFEIPVVSQTINYQGSSGLTRGGLDVLGYTVPNGGS